MIDLLLLNTWNGYTRENKCKKSNQLKRKWISKMLIVRELLWTIRVGQYDDYEIINYTFSSYSCTQSVIKHDNIQQYIRQYPNTRNIINFYINNPDWCLEILSWTNILISQVSRNCAICIEYILSPMLAWEKWCRLIDFKMT